MPSTLEARLKRLRGASTPADRVAPDSEPTACETTPSLAERLSRLAPVRTGRQQTREPDETVLAEAIGAEPIALGVLLLERRFEAGRRHGRAALTRSIPPAHLPLPRHWNAGPPAPEHWLYLDTETTGLAGGTGTWAFLTGLLRSVADGWRLRQYLLCRLDAEPAYLAAIASDLQAPAALVTYNGRSFDAPLLSTRYRLAGLPDPVAPLAHLDLLAPVRRAFARRWPDCRLSTAESRLLGLKRHGDLPGAAAPQAWLGWLRQGRITPLAAVLRHNRDDLLSLAGLIPALDRIYLDPSSCGADPRAVAASHTVRGDLPLAQAILQRHRADLTTAGLLDLAQLSRRLGDWPAAVEIWEGLEVSGEPQALIALARYHEHRSRDLRRALALADRLPTGEDRDRRRARLIEKLECWERNRCLGTL